jgi:ATP-dependent exoDNAse (exonuclease V) alpha subunit
MRQKQALNVMLSGASVFLTGAPGAGKTYVLNEFIKRARNRGKEVAVTASTGIAATHIGGTTIHSWSGLGISDHLTSGDKERLRANEKLTARYRSTDVLVIDEVSMLHGERLNMIDEVCKLLRVSTEPFGGLQIILVGDLFQLPPVTRGAGAVDFAYNSAAWQELNPRICYINEQHRQQSGHLLDVLEAMRSGEIEEWHGQLLKERLDMQPPADEPITRLYAHNVDVDAINQRELAALNGETQTFNMKTSGAKARREQLVKGLLAPEILELKIGAEVMFVVNNFKQKFFNGSRGRIVGFHEGAPIVKLISSDRTIRVEPHNWSLNEDGRVRAEAEQLPLRLAWAITIHKSQGMSLDSAQLDLSRSFTPGMGYVALSRVRTLEGLYLMGINQMAMRLHPDIYELDKALRRASEELSAITQDAEDEPEETAAARPVGVDLELLASLKEWRSNRAKADNVPAYIVAHDKLLQDIATHRPTTNQQLMRMPGIGPRKLNTYGAELLAITAQE